MSCREGRRFVSEYNPDYAARLVETTCDVCGVKCCHEKRLLARGKVPLCRACRYAALGRAKRAKPKITISVPCAVCERLLTRNPSRIARVKQVITCSVNCRNEARRQRLIRTSLTKRSGPGHPQWEGLREGLTSYGCNWKVQRDAAKRRDNYTCQDCGLTETTYGRALEVHHVVRFLDFETPEEANVLSNLRTLCRPCHRKADAVLYYARKASGEKSVRKFASKIYPRTRRRRKFTSFGELVCLLARNWCVTNAKSEIEGERVGGISQAIAAATKRPSKSRGLVHVLDMCQATTLARANAEIEANCWVFTLDGAAEPDPRLFEILLEAGDHRRIVSAQRIAFLDWIDLEMGGGQGWVDSRVSQLKCARSDLSWAGACGVGPRLPAAWRRWWPTEDSI